MKSHPRLPLLLLLATAVPGFQYPLAAQAPQPKDGDSIGAERPEGLHKGQTVAENEEASCYRSSPVCLGFADRVGGDEEGLAFCDFR